MSERIQQKWDKLKRNREPCPCCGSYVIHLDRSLGRRFFRYRLECWKCHWCGKQANTISGAIRRWNRDYYKALRNAYLNTGKEL